MPVILVTGGAGYVGSVCAEELIRQGFEVVVVDDLSTGHREAVPKDAHFYQVDIGEKKAMRRVMESHEIDAVFHFAAKALIPESVTDPAIFYKVNVTSSLAMMDVLRENGIRKFVFSSTAAVYGNPTEVPIPEDHPKSPVNSYGETKLAFERALQWYSQAYGFSVVAFRYFNASGATELHGELHQPETHIIPLVYEAATGERPHFTIYGGDYETPDGTCLRDYVHVLDIAQAHILALKHMDGPGFRAYNIGLGKSFSVKQLCASAEEVIGTKIPIKIGARRIGDPGVLCADPRRLMDELGWKPEHSELREILESAWNWKQQMAKKVGTSTV